VNVRLCRLEQWTPERVAAINSDHPSPNVFLPENSAVNSADKRASTKVGIKIDKLPNHPEKYATDQALLLVCKMSNILASVQVAGAK